MSEHSHFIFSIVELLLHEALLNTLFYFYFFILGLRRFLILYLTLREFLNFFLTLSELLFLFLALFIFFRPLLTWLEFISRLLDDAKPYLLTYFNLFRSITRHFNHHRFLIFLLALFLAFLLVIRFFFLNLLGYNRDLVVRHAIIKLIEALVLYFHLIFSIVGTIEVLGQVNLPVRVIFPGCPVFV